MICMCAMLLKDQTQNRQVDNILPKDAVQRFPENVRRYCALNHPEDGAALRRHQLAVVEVERGVDHLWREVKRMKLLRYLIKVM